MVLLYLALPVFICSRTLTLPASYHQQIFAAQISVLKATGGPSDDGKSLRGVSSNTAFPPVPTRLNLPRIPRIPADST